MSYTLATHLRYTRFIIKKDGSVEIEGIGFIGNNCLKELEKLIEALKQYGIEIRIEKQQLKPEYYHGIEEKQVEKVRS